MPGLFNFLRRGTAPALSPPPPVSAAEAAPPVSSEPQPWRLEAALRTDVGCRRETNEDHIRLVEPRPDDPRAPQGTLLVVADGMGGHEAGEVASALAVETIFRVFYQTDGPPEQCLRAAFEAANTAVWEAGQAPDKKGMGTTVTALLVRGPQAFVAHVGDSRLYHLRGNTLRQLTHDHSLVQEMVRKGMITPADAAHHEDRNVLLQALGNRPYVEVELSTEPLALQPGDVFLACSDGLHDGIPPDEIEGLLAETPDVQQAADTLVALAKARGGLDNISVGVVRLAAEARPLPQARPTRELPNPYPAAP